MPAVAWLVLQPVQGLLGYLIEEGAGTRAIRCGLIAVALIAGWTAWAVYVVAIWMLLVAGLRASQVAKEERA